MERGTPTTYLTPDEIKAIANTKLVEVVKANSASERRKLMDNVETLQTLAKMKSYLASSELLPPE
jgi:hypothetical protein